MVERSNVIVIASSRAMTLLPRITRLNPSARVIFLGECLPRHSPKHRAAVAVLLRHQASIEALLFHGPAHEDFAWAYPKVCFLPGTRVGRALVDQVLERSPDTSEAMFQPSVDHRETTSSVPFLSLIVATLGRTEPLVRLMTSLSRQNADAFEVIVVDQNGPGVLDDILDRFSGLFRIRHLRSRPGLSLARNVGLAASQGQIVGFPDDDCWYPPDRVSDIVHFFSLFSASDVLLGQTTDRYGRASVNAVRGASQAVTPTNIWFSGNSNTLFMRGSLARRLGFDETLGVGAKTPFQSGEESDLVLRALVQGARATYCPNLTIYHDQVNEIIGPAELRRGWRYSQGFGQVLRRHYSSRYIAYRTVRSFGGGVIAAFRGQFGNAVYRFTWALGTLRGALS